LKSDGVILGETPIAFKGNITDFKNEVTEKNIRRNKISTYLGSVST
jgi:hypothetical protein